MIPNDSSAPIRSVAVGNLNIAGRIYPCQVLSDERRLLDTSQSQALLGAAKDRHFRRLLARIPGLSADIQARPRIKFQRPDGRTTAYGYEASFVMDVCLAYQRAYLAEQLHPKQVPIAREAMALVAGCAKIGLDALIDEACGYVKRRPDEYRSRLERYLREERNKWHERWPTSTVRTFCRLYQQPYDPSRFPVFLFGIVGRIYDLLMGADVMGALRGRNAEPSKGHNHHQYFQDRVQRFVERELVAIEAIAETSPRKQRFWEKMFFRYRGDAFQTDFLD